VPASFKARRNAAYLSGVLAPCVGPKPVNPKRRGAWSTRNMRVGATTECAIAVQAKRAASVFQGVMDLPDQGRTWGWMFLLIARWVATNCLEGDFPGGVVDLRCRFAMDGDLVAELVIAP
jgi:hypothetical protein